MGLRVGQILSADEFLTRFGDKTARYELLEGQPIPPSDRRHTPPADRPAVARR